MHQITYKLDKTISAEPLYTKGRFDVIDYIITGKRWQHNTKDIYSDIESGVDTDHYPRITKVNLKASYHINQTRKKYIPCTNEQKATIQHDAQKQQAIRNNTSQHNTMDKGNSRKGHDRENNNKTPIRAIN